MNAPLSVQSWLLAEHIRHQEEQQGRLRGDEAANALAMQQSDSFATRIADRAGALATASSIQADLMRLKHGLGWLIAGLLILATLAGFGVVLGSVQARELEVLWVLMAVLGLPTLTLILWVLGMIFVGRSAPPMPWMHMVVSHLANLASKGLQGPHGEFTLKAALGLLATPAGRWGMSVVSHLFWLVLTVAALILLMLQFTVAQYDLGWGTTLLSEERAIALLQTLAWLPDQLNWLPENPEQWLMSGRLGNDLAQVRMEWAAFLLTLLCLYGVLPRLLALGLSVIMWRIFSRRMSLDLSQPGYVRLQGVLMPQAMPLPPSKARFSLPKVPLRKKSPTGQGVFLVAVESPGKARQALTMPSEFTDLGDVNTREDRVRVLAALDAKREPVGCLVVVCDARRTPDQGLVILINQLADVAKGALIVALYGVDGLSDWGVNPSSRMADWASLGEVTGADVMPIDVLPAKIEEVMAK